MLEISNMEQIIKKTTTTKDIFKQKITGADSMDIYF